MDYRDHRPQLNASLFLMTASGVGLRQSSRTLGMTLRCTELKLRKIARHLRRVNLNVRSAGLQSLRLHLDEFETYEEQRGVRPLSIAFVIESQSRLILWAEAAPIRPRGRMSESRKQAILRSEQRFGPRKDLSMRTVGRALKRAEELLESGAPVELFTDEKSTYPALARRVFRGRRLFHLRTNSEVPRTTWNPLFPINHEEGIARDLMARLRRKDWHTTKRRRYLDLGLQLHMAYRNLVRRRFNRDEGSPAVFMGFLPRRVRPAEVLGWRQDWGKKSPPLLVRSGGLL